MSDSQIALDSHARPHQRVDFLIIGAQKAGTTTLYRHIVEHPQIYMPSSKEPEFFSTDNNYDRGFDWYWDRYFGSAPEGAQKGEASTHYMMFPSVPARIRHALPDAKLVAILRNPIDRAYSHFRMSAMRGHEHRDFSAAIDDCFSALDVDGPFDVSADYLRFGEYGRILARYLEFFPRQQILILFTEDLATDPSGVVARTFEFLGVDPTFQPPTLGRRYNEGGVARAPRLMEIMRRGVGRLHRTPGVRSIVTPVRYEAFKFWTRTQLGVSRTADAGPSAALRRRLAVHYRPDIARLEQAFGISVPWPEL